jgi:peptidoglycan/LPS O-acetylase OafA/YrhL
MFWARWSRRNILLAIGLGVLASAMVRLFWYRIGRAYDVDRGYLVARLYMGLDTRADSLLIGSFTGLLASWNLLRKLEGNTKFIRLAALGSALGVSYVVLFSCFDHGQFFCGLYTVVAMMVATIVVCLLVTPWGLGHRLLSSAPLVALGRVSYSLYLVHMPIIAWCKSTGHGWRQPVELVGLVGTIFAAALISYFGVERPFLRWKDRFRAASNSRSTEAIGGGLAPASNQAAA